MPIVYSLVVMTPKWNPSINNANSVIESAIRQVNALTVRVEAPLSLTMKKSAEPRLARIKRMNSTMMIFTNASGWTQCSPAPRR